MTVPGTRRRPTSADVAREAGVSRTTVSYVLNQNPHQSIPETTRRRVLDAAARLGYAPSAAARTLSSGRSDIVLCLLPDWPIGPSVGTMIQALSSAVARDGLTLLTHPRPAGGAPVTDVWRTTAPAAVVTFDNLAEDDLTAMRAAGAAVAVALQGGQGRRHGGLEIPDERIGRLQAEHLASTGHRRLGYAFPDDARVAGFAGPRLAGVRAAFAELGLDDPVVRTVPLDVAEAARAVREWRTAPDDVTAVCAYNDEVALALLAGMREQGLNAPEDLAVVGVDDIPAARFADPALTTVIADSAALGKHLGEVICRRLAGRSAPRRPGSDIVQLVRRGSA